MKIIIYLTKLVIRIKINIEWSWKKINCSINGEFLFCKFKFDQDIINYLWILNSFHLIWHIIKFNKLLLEFHYIYVLLVDYFVIIQLMNLID